jgi:hypothetical protein
MHAVCLGRKHIRDAVHERGGAEMGDGLGKL